MTDPAERPAERQASRPNTPPLSDPPDKDQRDDQPLKELNDTPEGEDQPEDRGPEKRRDGR